MSDTLTAPIPPTTRSRPRCEGCGKPAGGGLVYCDRCLCVVFASHDPRAWEFARDRHTGTWMLRPRCRGGARRRSDPRQLLLFPER